MNCRVFCTKTTGGDVLTVAVGIHVPPHGSLVWLQQDSMACCSSFIGLTSQVDRVVTLVDCLVPNAVDVGDVDSAVSTVAVDTML